VPRRRCRFGSDFTHPRHVCARQRNERGCLICVCCISSRRRRRRASERAFLSFAAFCSAYVCARACKSACEPAWNKSRHFSLLHSLATITLAHVSLEAEFEFRTRTAAPNNVSVIMALYPSAHSQCECITVVVIMHFKCPAVGFAFLLRKSVPFCVN
jgi:hypothetical protein